MYKNFLTVLSNLKYFYYNKYVVKSHCLSADSKDLKQGEWYDLSDRLLPCIFNELKNFVEIELAYTYFTYSSVNEGKKSRKALPFNKFNKDFNRYPELGLKYLKWQSEFVWTEEELGKDHPDLGSPTTQALNALEVISLYKWWTTVYPLRKKHNLSLDEQKQYEKEDDQMMIRLINIRVSLKI